MGGCLDVILTIKSFENDKSRFSNSRLFIRYMKEALSMMIEKVAQGEFPKGRGVSGTTKTLLWMMMMIICH